MPIGIPTNCLYNLVPNRIKYCPTKRSEHHIHFDKTMHDILGFNAFLSLHEGLDGGVWYSLFIKNLAHYSSH